MKKFLISCALFGIIPAYAACPVNNETTVCTLPGFREQLSPTYSQKTNINEFADSPEVSRKPDCRQPHRKHRQPFRLNLQ